MKIQKKELSLVTQGIFLVLLICLIGCGIMIVCNNSIAWFSNNRHVSANGASVSIDDIGIEDTYYYWDDASGDYMSIESWEHIFAGMMPGDTVTIKAEYKNTSGEDRAIRVVFAVPPGGEIPIIEDGKYYYLSTQLQITEINGGEQNLFLLTPPENGIDYEAEQTLDDITLVNPLSIASGATATVEFTVQFVNYSDIDQNAYQGFGAKGETCFRQVVAYRVK